jgi:hypothetical protein
MVTHAANAWDYELVEYELVEIALGRLKPADAQCHLVFPTRIG